VRLRRVLLSLVLAVSLTPTAAIFTPVPAVAQAQAGTISGTVVSGDQAPLADATVTVTGPAKQTATTGKDGTFTVTGLPDGAYLVSVTHAGYAAVKGTPVVLTGGAPQSLAVTLISSSLNSLRTIGSVSANGGRTSTALNTSAAAQATITSQQLTDRGQTTVVNMLEELPGVEITRNSGGAPGSNSDVSIRGSNPYEAQVLIDGHPVDGGSQGKYLIQFLNPLILSDVEVDKGPGVFGDSVENAVSGTVNFRTPQISMTPTGTILGGYDSFDGSMVGGRFSDTFGKFGFLVGYAETGTPGYVTGNILSVASANSSASATAVGMAPAQATVNTLVPGSESYNNRSELLKFGFNFSPTTTLTAGFFGSQSLVDYTGSLATEEPYTIVGSCATCGAGNTLTFTNPQFAGLIGQTVLAANNEDELFAGDHETDSEPIFSVDLRSAFGKGTFLARYYAGSITRLISEPSEAAQILGCPNPACNPFTPGGASFNENEIDQLHGGDFEYDLPIGAASLTLSYDTHDDRTTFCESTCTTNGLLVASTTYSLRGYIPLSQKLTFGLANYLSSTTFVGDRYDPRASFVYRPGKYQSLRFAAGTAFVAPPSSFVAGVAGPNGTLNGAGFTTSAPGPGATLDVISNLKPETSESFDLGGDFYAGRDAKFTVDLYDTLIRNRFATQTITLLPGATGFFNGLQFGRISELFNISDSHEQGIELGFIKAPRVGFGTNIAFDLNHDYDFNTAANPLFAGGSVGSGVQPSTFNESGAIADGTQIPGFAYTKGRAEISYAFAGGAHAAFGMNYYGDYNSYGENAFTMFDANFGIPLLHGFKLQVAGINIFNHDGGRGIAEFAEGAYAPIAAPGQNTTPVNLFFAPPRQVTFQLSHPL
jgi:outer membrane receptor protein involved in Fe transport